MKTFKYFIIPAVILLFPAVLKAQAVRYVAYFPIPYVTHLRIEANTAYFAGRDNGTLQIGGNLDLSDKSLESRKDLKLKTNSDSSISGDTNTTLNLSVGSKTTIYNGDFIVDNASSSLTIKALPSSIGNLYGDETLEVKSISWGNNSAFVKGSTTPSGSYALNIAEAPNSTKKFCWSPLRIKGTYEYKYYLIAYDSNTCPN